MVLFARQRGRRERPVGEVHEQARARRLAEAAVGVDEQRLAADRGLGLLGPRAIRGLQEAPVVGRVVGAVHEQVDRVGGPRRPRRRAHAGVVHVDAQQERGVGQLEGLGEAGVGGCYLRRVGAGPRKADRKSTRLNSSHRT